MAKEAKFDFEEKRIINEIKKRNAGVVLLQLPEGIKTHAHKLAEILEKNTKAKIIVSGETCWGGCDIALDEAKNMNADLIVHFGHAPFRNIENCKNSQVCSEIKDFRHFDFPIIYAECRDNFDLMPLIKKSLAYLKKFKKIALVTSVQHIHKLTNVKKILEDNGKKIIIPEKLGNCAYSGHIVGCEYSGLKKIKNNFEVVLVLGNRFHALGAALAQNKPVFLADVYNNNIEEMAKFKEKIIRQRAIAIDKIKDAKNIGIIIGLKPGQKFGSADALKEEFEKNGKNAVIITMSEITKDKLMSFYNIDGFVELACPRIAVDDFEKYEKPIITYREALVALGKLKWNDLLDDGFI